MANQLISFRGTPNTTMQVTLNIDGGYLTLRLRFYYNEMANVWMLAVSDQNNVMLLDSIPLLTGVYPAANILQQYAYLKIGSAYVLNVSNTSDMDYPNVNGFNADFVLAWSDTPAV